MSDTKRCPDCRTEVPITSPLCTMCGTVLEDDAERYIGQVLFDKYRCLERLAKGRSSFVFRAEHVKLEVPRAVKILRPELVENLGAVDTIWREARHASSVRHPNVVVLHDVEALPDATPCSVWEMVPGPTLLARVEQAPLGGAAAGLARGLAAGLGALHAAGLAHLDLGPEHVLLAGDALEPRLLGFAQTRPLGHKREVSKRRLRLGFAAPEQFEPGAADARADVFTLGALLYFAATGHTVGPSSSADDYARAAAALEPAALAGVDGLPADLRHLITICLAPDPSWRPASAAAVLHAAETLGLEATRDGDPLSTLRPRPATVRPGPMLPLEIDDAVLANRQPRPPRARLEPITGFTADIVLAAPSVTIGRLDSNAVQIDHPTISKRHARLWFEDGRYRFEDVGSRNGSSVNGRRVTGRVALADGDVVAMGEVVCRFRVEVS